MEQSPEKPLGPSIFHGPRGGNQFVYIRTLGILLAVPQTFWFYLPPCDRSVTSLSHLSNKPPSTLSSLKYVFPIAPLPNFLSSRPLPSRRHHILLLLLSSPTLTHIGQRPISLQPEGTTHPFSPTPSPDSSSGTDVSSFHSQPPLGLPFHTNTHSSSAEAKG